MDKKLKNKILKLAVEILRMHGNIAGNRICQDWDGEMVNIDALTPEEKNQIMMVFENYNSEGRDYEPDYFPLDEMVISYAIAANVELMIDDADQN